MLRVGPLRRPRDRRRGSVVEVTGGREALVARNRALVLENLELADAFVASHAELVDWVRPNASPIGFPRFRVPDTYAFCERLAADAGVLLLPGEVYDAAGHVRIGLGRVGAADAFARLAAYVSAL